MTRGLRVTCVVQCGEKILLAFALEFFLRGLEARDARSDFFPLFPHRGGGVALFGHAHPFLIRVPSSLTAGIGARIGTRPWELWIGEHAREIFQRPGIAVDKRATMLVAFAPSR